MRALVMDFPADRNALDTPDQFMFGPALLVSPVTRAGATSRSIYLPAELSWYDFWTGASQTGGHAIAAAAPLETMPLFVRAGSIIPMGPELQYTSEKAADPLELRIYPGTNGQFTLYEDDGESYAYEKHDYATIAFTWNDATQSLTIGARLGSFTGMLKDRNFRIVRVGQGHGVGEGITETPDRVVRYDGATQSIQFAPR
jgi:alpha-D-xyloside xylohydrolase